MNTQAIATFIPATGAETTKNLSRDASASDTPFNQILNREMADRQKNEPASAASAQEKPSSGKAESKVAEASKKMLAEKDQADKEVLTDTPTAEQILMMAAQFNQSHPTTQPSATNTNLPATQIDETVSATGLPPQLGNTDKFAEQVLSGKATTEDTTTANTKRENAGDAFNNMLDKVATEKSATASNGALKDAPVLPSVADTTENFAGLIGKQSMETALNKTSDAPDVTSIIAPLQQAATALTDKVAGSNNNHIPSQIGSASWNEAIGQKIVWMVGNEEQSASLTLNPPDLGPMHVVLSVSSTHANASFYSPHAEVRDALEAALPKLREMLGTAGLQLGNADVNAGSPQQQNHFTTASNTGRSGITSIETAGSVPTVTTTSSKIMHNGLVDTFA